MEGEGWRVEGEGWRVEGGAFTSGFWWKKNKRVKHDSGMSLNQEASVAYGNTENDQIPVAAACCSPGEAGTRATCRRPDPH